MTVAETEIEDAELSQCMAALARANEVRLARAALKRDIYAGRASVIEVIDNLPWETDTMSLRELLSSQRRWGAARSRKLLATCALGEGKKVGTLTRRQRGVLIAALEAKAAA